MGTQNSALELISDSEVFRRVHNQNKLLNAIKAGAIVNIRQIEIGALRHGSIVYVNTQITLTVTVVSLYLVITLQLKRVT